MNVAFGSAFEEGSELAWLRSGEFIGLDWVDSKLVAGGDDLFVDTGF